MFPPNALALLQPLTQGESTDVPTQEPPDLPKMRLFPDQRGPFKFSTPCTATSLPVLHQPSGDTEIPIGAIVFRDPKL